MSKWRSSEMIAWDCGDRKTHAHRKTEADKNLTPQGNQRQQEKWWTSWAYLSADVFLRRWWLLWSSCLTTLLSSKSKQKSWTRWEASFYVSRNLFAAKTVARDLPGYRTNMQIKSNWSLIKLFQLCGFETSFCGSATDIFRPNLDKLNKKLGFR